MSGIEVTLQGTVHKVTVRPPKLDEQGAVSSQDIELVLRVPIDGHEGVRIKLPDLSRLQNGKMTNITLEETAPALFKDEEMQAKKKPVGALKVE